MKAKFFFLLSATMFLFGCSDEQDTNDVVSVDKQYITKEAKATEQAIDFLNGLLPQTRSVGMSEVGSVYPWLKNASGNVTRSAGEDNDTLFFVVNFTNNHGYAIVSADEDTGNEVYAYVENGSYVPGDSIDNPGLKDFIEDMIKYADWTDIEPYSEPLQPIYNFEPWTIDTLFTPLLTTKWGQGAPFNTYCYSPSGELSVAGCVAIALGQIFTVHQYPSSYAGHTYSWSDMLTGIVPTNSAGQESAARLINDIGVLVDMQYSPSGSGAYTDSVHNCLDAFGYQSYEYYSGYDFGLCANSVNLGCPVYMSGARWDNSSWSYKGHAWVIDGILVRHQLEVQIGNEWVPYDVHRYVHCNWGWNGSGNGYFLSGVFDVRNRELMDNLQNPTSYYDVDRNYAYYRKMIYNISRRSLTPLGPLG